MQAVKRFSRNTAPIMARRTVYAVNAFYAVYIDCFVSEVPLHFVLDIDKDAKWRDVGDGVGI